MKKVAIRLMSKKRAEKIIKAGAILDTAIRHAFSAASLLEGASVYDVEDRESAIGDLQRALDALKKLGEMDL
jgi:hypothetical protein